MIRNKFKINIKKIETIPRSNFLLYSSEIIIAIRIEIDTIPEHSQEIMYFCSLK